MVGKSPRGLLKMIFYYVGEIYQLYKGSQGGIEFCKLANEKADHQLYLAGYRRFFVCGFSFGSF